MPSNLAMKLSNILHRGLIKTTAGRRGWDLINMPVLKLTTTGRKTGLARTVMLTSPHQIGSNLVIVASKGGADQHPEWFLNLESDPHVHVETRNSSQEMTARIINTDEREALWEIITAKYGNYLNYQRKTKREIPLVVLE
ncbi:MAG: nitroreductase family deazaflavin-dependent oxidoreductase [Acidimicrobiales bacterium]|nr:nitroreductase family deazaflavin-dependent oxidoreductase [Acidimicrobiales bacterium]